MADIRTRWLGLDLANPLIAGASGLTADLETIKRLEESGIGALVVKSLFEEQLQLERYRLAEDQQRYSERHAEMLTLFPEVVHSGPEEHLLWVRRTREAVSIPVVAGLNCVNFDNWGAYAKQLEEAGADALELNFYAVPRQEDRAGTDIEMEQLEVVRDVCSRCTIPVSVKLSPFYSNIYYFAKEVVQRGARGVVVFNRLFEPDIDPGTEQHILPVNLSQPGDVRLSLRYTGLLSGQIDGSICAGGGVASADDIIKLLLAGADGVQIVSVLYRKGPAVIPLLLDGLQRWMDSRGYARLDDFRSKMDQQHTADSWVYQRAQYIRMLMQHREALTDSGELP